MKDSGKLGHETITDGAEASGD
jgi:hypothetical protein